MASRSDDSASPDAGADEQVRATLPRGWRAVGKGADEVVTVPDPAPPVSDSAEDEAHHFAGDEVEEATVAAASDDLTMSNAVLLGIGAFAGIYLLYTIGWFIGAERISLPAQLLLNGGVSAADASFALGIATFQILKWTAIAAPFIWFVVTFVLTRHSRSWVRFVWLVAGALLLVPWPLFVPFAAVGGAQ